MNPVLRKDILSLLRLKRIAAIQILFVAVLAVLLLASWPRGGVLSLSAQNQDDLLLGLIIGQLVVLVLAVPGVAAVSITGEREANTFEMLYASRMSAIQIVFGKVMSAVAFPFLLIIAGLPFVGLLYFRGAVNIGTLFLAYVIIVVTAIVLAILGLTVSAVSRLTSNALVMSYLLVLGLCGGVLVPAAIMLNAVGGQGAVALHTARALSPIAAVFSLLRPDIGAGDFAGHAKGNWPSHWIFLIASAVIVPLCLIILVVRLRRPPAETERLDDAKNTLHRGPMLTLNPVFSKERRTNTLSSGRWMVRIFYGMLVLSLLLSVMSLSGGTAHSDLLLHVFQVLVTFQIVAVAAVAPSLTSSAISSEIESGTFEALRLTRLGGWQIFLGKFLPVFLPAVLPIIALVPAFVTVCWVDPAYVKYLIYLLPIIALTMVFCCVLGLLCSSFTTSTARATVVAYIIVSALVVLPMLAWWTASAGLVNNPRLIDALSMPSPLVIALNLAPPVTSATTHAPVVATHVEGLRTMHEWVIGAACLLMLVVSRLRLAFLLRRG